MTLAIEVDLRPQLGPVRDQGRRATCLAFATSAVHRHLHRHASELSVEWLFYHAVTRAGDDPAHGSTIVDTQAVLRELGQSEEGFWPYQPHQPVKTAWRPPAGSAELLRCAAADRDHGAAAIAEALAAAHPVVLGLVVTEAFFGPWRRVAGEAVLRDDGLPAEGQFGHAVVAVGCGTLAGVPHLLIRNSWGSRWGRDGHAWMANHDVGRRLIGAFTVREGVETGVSSDAVSSHSRARLASRGAAAEARRRASRTDAAH